MKKIKVGIIGAAGYTAGELLRILVNHPNVDICFAQSNSNAGKNVYDVHQDLFGDTSLVFSNQYHSEIEVVFLCVAHGEALEWVKKFQSSVKIIDLSQDHRMSRNDHTFVYGLPEINRDLIKKANFIANPGCFATAIQLAILPLVENHLLPKEVNISCTTGSTGAGQSFSETSHFSWRDNNLSVYKAFTHQHLLEINQTIKSFNNLQTAINMIPQRGAFTRGIMANVVLTCDLNIDEIEQLYHSKYENEPFVFISKNNIHLKQVVNTNKCLIYLEKFENKLLVVSIIDNLLKGASGQAVQNMNLMFGLDEKTSLKLKANAF